MNRLTAISPLAYILGFIFFACIVAANYATTHLGGEDHMVPVGLGLTATAGTYFAGLTFIVRDSFQDAVKIALPSRWVMVEHVRQFNGRVVSSDWRRERKPATSKETVPYVLFIIVAGAGLSYFLSEPFIALASGAAFLVSEITDLLVYTPLRKKGYLRAALASNVAGAFVDTIVFLWIAGFPIVDSLGGQMFGKLVMTGVVFVLVLLYRGVRRWRTNQS